MDKTVQFFEQKKIEYKLSKSLKDLTTFKIGGTAKYCVYPKNEKQIKLLVKYFTENRIAYYVLGKGSNVLASDNGFNGAIISTAKLTKISRLSNTVVAECGVCVATLASRLQKWGLKNGEFLYAMPGSVAGAVVGNSGCFLHQMCDIIKKVKVLFNGKTFWLKKNECNFGYRNSIFKNEKFVVLKVVMQFERGDCHEIYQKMQSFKARKFAQQPLTQPSAGSVFLRTDVIPAKLIDNACLKGYVVGGAEISQKHANFIVNNGTATAKDVVSLIDHVKKCVKEKYGCDLATEIRFLGEFNN